MDTSTTTPKKRDFKHAPKLRDAARWNMPPEVMKRKLKKEQEDE